MEAGAFLSEECTAGLPLLFFLLIGALDDLRGSRSYLPSPSSAHRFKARWKVDLWTFRYLATALALHSLCDSAPHLSFAPRGHTHMPQGQTLR